MVNLVGINVTTSIVPGTTEDIFPTHMALYGKGGWREVATIAERDAIPDPRLEVGMSVYVASEKKLYILSSLDTTTTPYTKTWTLFSAGGVTVIPTPGETELGNIVQYIGETTEDYTQGYFYKCVSDGADPAVYSWEQIDVQPATDLIWGNIGGTLSEQTDLQNALDSKQDVLTPGTNITIAEDSQTGDLVISSTSYESLFKGKYNTWNDVPTVGANYPLYIDDGVHTHEPTYTDYIVVVDASTVPGGQVPIVITFRINAYSQQGSVKTNIDGTEYNGYGSFDGKVQVRTDVSTGNYGTQFVVLGEDIEYQGTTYHQGQVFLEILHNRVVYGQEYTYNAKLSLGYPYEGTWRFSYRGVWATDNRNGWKGEYPIEQELPIASDTVAGITKIYSATGQNTDGTMTQKSITDAINRIQDSCFRGNWDTWSDVPVSANLYPEDYKYSHVPTWNDYMVVNDASGYVPSDLLTVELIVVEMTNSTCRYTIGTDSYTATRQSGQNAPFGPNNEMSWNTQGMGTEGTVITFNDQVKYQDHVYNAGESIRLANESGSYSVADLPKSFFIKRHIDSFAGAWRFSYQGVWATDGKSGWKDEYQIENTLPIATPTVAGITKLYTTTGSNTDGTMDQNSITTELNGKLDTVSTADRVYGTDSQGNQTTYDKNSFGQVDDVQIHGDSKVVSKIANLSVVEQHNQNTMPVPSQDLSGRIVQYIGPNGLVSGYVHGYFYECQYVTTESYIELEVIKQPGTQLDIVTCDKDLLEANQGTTTNSWTFISHGGWNEWYLDDVHIDLNDWGISYQGEPSEDDEIDLDYTEASSRYIWVAIPVQPDAEPITNTEIDEMWS